MTRQEFSQFIQEFRVTFPNFASWVNRLEQTTGEPAKATFDAWFPSLEEFTLLELQHIIPLMRDDVEGYEMVLAVDYGEIHKYWRRYVRKWRWDTQQPSEPARDHYKGAWTHVTAADAVMCREYKRLLEAQDGIRKRRKEAGLPKLKPVELNRAALEEIGGVKI